MCRGPGTYPFHDPRAARGLQYELVVHWTAQRPRFNLQQTSAYRSLGSVRLQAGIVYRQYPCRISHAAPLPRSSAKMTEQTGVARDVRRRQLPAEHAAAMNDGRYTPQSGHLLATQYRLLRA